MSLRYSIEPRDISPEKAARRLGLDLARFEEALPGLLQRGFPPADPTTGNYDLDAIDLWRRSRHAHLFGLTAVGTARDAANGLNERLARMR